MCRFFGRFARDQQGSIAIIFALCFAPLMALVGLAIDYTRMAGVQARAQAALDAAAIAAARQAHGRDVSALQQIAQREFAASFGSMGDAQLGAVRLARDGARLRLDLDGAVNTTLAGIMGVNQLRFPARSDVAWRQPRIELTLVLDNTGSMGWGGKMPALKQASLDLLRELEALRTSPDQVKVAIVPFDTQVNVGTGFRNAPWIRFDDSGLPGELATTASAWQGCLTDRDQPHDVTDIAPVDLSTRYRAARCGTGSLARLQPLTADFAPLRATVNAMQPSGWTNITIGLQTGLAVMSPGLPFDEAYRGPDEVLRYMVLLTDGDNTKSRTVDANTNPGAIDARTRLACNAVKQAGIQLFTVRVIEGNEPLLRACASASSMYFSVRDAGGISDAFRAITRQIARLRLTA